MFSMERGLVNWLLVTKHTLMSRQCKWRLIL